MFYLYLWISAQIIIEMLPISSSGHLTLLELLLKKYASFDIRQIFFPPAILKSIYYFMHGPTLLIICAYFFAQWWRLVFTSAGIAWRLILCLVIADLITFIIYLVFKRTNITIPLGLGFIITAIFLFSTAWCSASKALSLLSFTDAAILGLVQGLALLPGVSRLAFTCSIGCWLGFSLADAFLLSWTMQAPLMAAAFAKSLKDLYELGALTQVLNLPIGLVMLVSSGVSFLALYGIGQMAHHITWYCFGWYMFVPLIIWIFQRSYPSTRPKGLLRDER